VVYQFSVRLAESDLSERAASGAPVDTDHGKISATEIGLSVAGARVYLPFAKAVEVECRIADFHDEA
jgi:hypothetical protein